MFDKFMKKLQNMKKQDDLMKFDLKTVQAFYEMQDSNKWLKFNAITQEQLQRTEHFEEHFNSIINKLYVPDYQSQNV